MRANALFLSLSAAIGTTAFASVLNASTEQQDHDAAQPILLSPLAVAKSARQDPGSIPATTATTELPNGGKIGVIQFDEPFADPDEATATEMAKLEGLSVAEATRRLRIMNKASVLSVKLEKAYPREFSGIRAEQTPKFRILMRFSGSSAGKSKARVTALTTDKELLDSIEDAGAPTRSRSEMEEIARSLTDAMKKAGVEAYVAKDAFTGDVKILAPDPAKAQQILNGEGSLRSVPIKIEQFDGIEPTWGGGNSYNGVHLGCTTGFAVRNASLRNGITTAAHCENIAKWDITRAYTGLSGDTLYFLNEWAGSGANGLDIQWSFDSDTHFEPYINIGSANLNITGGQSDYAGLYVCKYGRKTRRTCGYVDPYQYTNPTYGDMPRVNSNSTYPKMNDLGDSGGPVYTGSLAVGNVHGKDAAGNMYYTALRSWVPNGLPIQATCYC